MYPPMQPNATCGRALPDAASRVTSRPGMIVWYGSFAGAYILTLSRGN
jgi:hypothetical protein